MIVLKDYDDSMFDFILSSNTLNEPKVGFLDKEKLQHDFVDHISFDITASLEQIYLDINN